MKGVWSSLNMFLQLRVNSRMARGQQKIQSQQKNAEKQAKLKKGQASDQKKAAAAALVYTCTVCKVNSPNPINPTLISSCQLNF